MAAQVMGVVHDVPGFMADTPIFEAGGERRRYTPPADQPEHRFLGAARAKTHNSFRQSPRGEIFTGVRSNTLDSGLN
jgi:hypothetical protein